jgi:hypothetical protein
MSQRGGRKADELLLLALACGATVEAAAQKAGISRATAHRRLQDPEFLARLQQVSSDMVKRTMRTLTAAGSEAIKTLLALLQATTPYATRLGSARAILELGIKTRELGDMEERLQALEERLPREGPRT